MPVLSQRTHTIFTSTVLADLFAQGISVPLRDTARRSVTIEPREVGKTTQQFTYQGDHLVNGIAVPDIEPVILYSVPVNWWPTLCEGGFAQEAL